MDLSHRSKPTSDRGATTLSRSCIFVVECLTLGELLGLLGLLDLEEGLDEAALFGILDVGAEVACN